MVVSRWIKIHSQRDVIIYTIVTTLASIAFSLLIVLPALYWLEPSALKIPITYIITVLAPLLAAPFVTGFAYQMIYRLETSRQQLEYLSRTDALTKLYNRGYFWERVQQELVVAWQKHLSVAVIIFDIDDFKQFNDTHGHLMGDSILQSCAQSAARCLRKGDYIARHGGEEFAVFLNDCTIEQAKEVAERIRLAVAETRLFQDHLSITVSLGLVTSDAEVSLEFLVKRADDAMYVAKSQGKNRVVAVSL
jgi:diguanylate cyclase (GGDEF)-like protein